MSNKNASIQSPPPHVGILQILNGAHVAGAVSCLAQLGIPDLLESGPKSYAVRQSPACEASPSCVVVSGMGADGPIWSTA